MGVIFDPVPKLVLKKSASIYRELVQTVHEKNKLLLIFSSQKKFIYVDINFFREIENYSVNRSYFFKAFFLPVVLEFLEDPPRESSIVAPQNGSRKLL